MVFDGRAKGAWGYVAAAGIVVCALLLSALDGPHPSDGKGSGPPKPGISTEKLEAKVDRRGTQATPLVVQIPPTAEDKAREADQTSRENNSAGREWLVVWFTGALTAATIILAFFTYLLWNSTRGAVEEAKSSSGAASASAAAAEENAKVANEALEHAREAHILAQRPRLSVSYITIDPPDEGYRDILFADGHKVSGSLIITNIGGTAATIVFYGAMAWWTMEGLPMVRPYQGVDIELPLTKYDIDPGEFITAPFISMIPLGGIADDLRRAARNIHLYVLGRILYKDSLGIHRRTNFCRIYESRGDNVTPRFHWVADPDYNDDG